MPADTASKKEQVESNDVISSHKIPARVQHILDSQKDKFKKIEHYYAWEILLPSWGEYIIYFALLGLVVFIGLFFVPYIMGFPSKAFEWMLFLIAESSVLICIIMFCIWFKRYYEANENPGCVALTDTGLLTIVPGKGKKYDWLPYADIESAEFDEDSVIVPFRYGIRATHISLSTISRLVFRINLKSGKEILITLSPYSFWGFNYPHTIDLEDFCFNLLSKINS